MVKHIILWQLNDTLSTKDIVLENSDNINKVDGRTAFECAKKGDIKKWSSLINLKEYFPENYLANYMKEFKETIDKMQSDTEELRKKIMKEKLDKEKSKKLFQIIKEKEEFDEQIIQFYSSLIFTCILTNRAPHSFNFISMSNLKENPSISQVYTFKKNHFESRISSLINSFKEFENKENFFIAKYVAISNKIIQGIDINLLYQ